MDETTSTTASVGVTEAIGSVTARVLPESERIEAQIAELKAKRDAVKATEDFKSHFVNSEGQPHTDQYSIDGAFLRAAGGAMEARLRVGGFPDWHTASTDTIVARAKTEVDAGNLIDAAICLLMAKAHQSPAA